MAYSKIRDDVIWSAHIYGRNSTALRARVKNLPEGEMIMLTVDGVTGRWCGMRDGQHPTHGVRAIGAASAHWQALQERRGDTIEIEES